MQNTLFIILSYVTSFQKHLLFYYYVVAFSTANRVLTEFHQFVPQQHLPTVRFFIKNRSIKVRSFELTSNQLD